MSKQSLSLLNLSVKATGPVVEFRFLAPAGAQAAAAANTLGVAQHSGVAGDMITTTVLGTSVVEAGAAIAAGTAVETDASGRAVTKAAGPTVGRTLQAASQAGDVVEVLLIPN